MNDATAKRRQILYWHMLHEVLGEGDSPGVGGITRQLLQEQALPADLADSRQSIDTICQRYPELKTAMLSVIPGSEAGSEELDELRRAALFGKLMINIYGKLGFGLVSASDYSDWCQDVGWFEQANDLAPGQLRGKGPGKGVSDEDLSQALEAMEGDLIKRMKLREVLANNALAQKLTPSMALVEELLRDKSNLSGVALANAKRLIRQYVDQVAEILKTQVAEAKSGEVDRSVPPKRVFRNLDLKRTVWKNLVNWDPDEQRLYVDRLYYRHTAQKNRPNRLIVVVDQSGSMVDSMVNCAILASIFAGLPKVDPHLIAFDTKAIDLTPWVHDPFEVLMRTDLGGGNDALVAVDLVRPKLHNPQDTVVVWISDFYEFQEQAVWNAFKSLIATGLKFIPVGSVSSSGGQYVNPWFRKRFKELNLPVISGSIKKLIIELKKFLT